jgi:hypothetical protein
MPPNDSNAPKPLTYEAFSNYFVANFYYICDILLSSKRAQYHYKRALANGLKVEVGSDTIRVATIDSIPVIKNDTIVWEKVLTYKDTILMYRTVTLPKTRWQTKIEWKYRTKIEKIKGDVITKQHEVVRYKLRWWPFWLGLAIPFLLRLLWSLVLTKINR